jgi:hypothetical protein
MPRVHNDGSVSPERCERIYQVRLDTRARNNAMNLKATNIVPNTRTNHNR